MGQTSDNRSFSERAVLDVIEEMHEGLQIIDVNFCYLYINKAASQHGRSDNDALIGRSMEECYPGIQDTEMFSLLKATMDDRKTRRMENEFRFPEGDSRWFDLLFEAHTSGVLIRSLDISDRKKVEEKYTHAEKMNALGKLAGGVAHDFNNKLGIMQIYCELAKKAISKDQPEVADYIDQISTAIKDSSGLTHQLLALSRRQVLELKPMNINTIIKNLEKALGQMMGERIEVVYSLSADVHEIKMDISQIDQILLNLFVNAKDAMAEGGTLTIETENVYLDENYWKAQSEVESGDYVLISVSDTGCGMSEETKREVFEPYFTTKPLRQGTGLGLASVHGIIRQARGHIWVYSEEGLGTTFKLYFPKHKSEGQHDPPAIQKDESKPLRGEETLMLVEDNDMLREAITEALESVGFTVIVASGLEEAKPLFLKHKNEVDLLITDLILKKSKGNELAAALTKEQPNLKVLFISGFTENSITNHGVLENDFILLQKPFSIKSLLEVIRKIIDTDLVRGVF